MKIQNYILIIILLKIIRKIKIIKILLKIQEKVLIIQLLSTMIIHQKKLKLIYNKYK
jgi:hypothetical protein